MEFIQKMNAALRYIEEHLNEEIDQSKLAHQAGTSTFQFQRVFGFVTGISLAEYIRRRRFTLAAIEIQTTNRRILDIAFDYGYESHESFTRAFKKIHNISPSEARKPGASLKAYPKLTFTLTIQGTEEMNYRIEKKHEFRMFGKERIISTLEGQNFIEIPKFWQDSFTDGTVEAIYEATGEHFDENHVGRFAVHAIMCHRETGKDTFPYMIGGIVGEKSDIAGYEVVDVPELEWAVFTTEYYNDDTLVEAIQTVWKRIFAEWFPTSGYEHDNGPELEVYFTAGGGKDYCEIWIPVKKK